MNPRRYQQADWRIQWAYLFEEVRPLQTSTCALFWRSVVLTPLKLLGPLLGGGVVLLIVTASVGNTLFPAYLPAWMIRPQRPSTPWSDVDTILAVSLCALIFFVVLGEWVGLWAYLHAFCLPVEIEGGLVVKGTCPSCPGRLVLIHDGQWECRRCHGHFVPHVETEDEEVTA